MQALFYDWLGVNEWLFNALSQLNAPFVGGLWYLLQYGYGYWVPLLVGLGVCVRYLKVRHKASESESAVLSEIMAVLILAFSLVWCTIYTVQTVTLWPRPWMLYPETVHVQSLVLWHEGFPASAPAIAMMVSSIFWRHAGGTLKVALTCYVGLSAVLSIVSGQSWPVDVLVGLMVGVVGVRLARTYYRFAMRLAAH